ncbi:MAG: FGGY-family carbohydrate kinase [Lachnospiraceae bacterium]
MEQYVIGLDNGGTSTKAAIFNLTGKEIAVASRHTQMITPKSGYTERDMEQLWTANCVCVKEAIEKAGIKKEDVLGIAVCGHGKGMYLWGKDGKPAYNGIVSTDSRAWKYPKKWKEMGIWEKWHSQLCQEPMACQQVSLLAWFKEHHRMVYDNINWVFSVKDYVRFRMTGEPYSEATDISGSGLMDVKNARIDKVILEDLGIGEAYDMIAPIKYSYENCGAITAEAAEKMGLKEGTPVAGGMFDIDSCAVAMDVTSPEELITIAGTWSINEYISREPVLDGSIAMNSLFAIPGYYLVEECSATSSGNMEWYIENCLSKEDIPIGKDRYQYINELVETVPPEECEVYFLPFLYGSNAHPLGKGAFVGLTTFHGKQHMLRAIYEGVVYSAKTHIDRLLSSRKDPKAIRMAGGPVNSEVWVQMFADILGFPIEIVDVKELGALGCGMAAAIAAGVYIDYKDAAKSMVKMKGTVMPDLKKTKIYQQKYKKYCAVSTALDGVWEQFEV